MPTRQQPSSVVELHDPERERRKREADFADGALGWREACAFMGGISRETLYQLGVTTAKVGRRRVWAKRALARLLAESGGG